MSNSAHVRWCCREHRPLALVKVAILGDPPLHFTGLLLTLYCLLSPLARAGTHQFLLRITHRQLPLRLTHLLLPFHRLIYVRTYRPPQSTRRPLQSTRQPLQATRRPLQSTLRPPQSTRRPLQSTRRPLQSTRRLLQTTLRPHQSTPRPLHLSFLLPLHHLLLLPLLLPFPLHHLFFLLLLPLLWNLLC
jgi:hypothetical protein